MEVKLAFEGRAVRFEYHDMYDHQFEQMVVEICHEILGSGVIEFTTGKDGGRDAKFEGTANEFPSRTQPLTGCLIIQAKHTEHPFAKVSDTDFGGDAASSTITKEIKKIKTLREKGEVDHYLIFANRRAIADATVNLTERIKNETGILSVHFFGVEKIDRLLKKYPAIAIRLALPAFDAPLRVSPDDIALVITRFVQRKEEFAEAVTDASEIHRVKFATKNVVNRLSKDYAVLIQKHIKDFDPIKRFLSNPENSDMQLTYMDAVAEFQSAIISHQGDFQVFDKVLDSLFQLLIKRDSDLARHKALTRLVLFYMYWNCDIGKGENF